MQLVYKLEGVALLTTDPPPTSFTTLSDFYCFIHINIYIYILTHDTWHVTCDTQRVWLKNAKPEILAFIFFNLFFYNLTQLFKFNSFLWNFLLMSLRKVYVRTFWIEKKFAFIKSVVNIVSTFQVPSSYGLGVRCFEDF